MGDHSTDLIELERLAALREKGHLTEEEFLEGKRRIFLKNPSAPNENNSSIIAKPETAPKDIRDATGDKDRSNATIFFFLSIAVVLAAFGVVVWNGTTDGKRTLDSVSDKISRLAEFKNPTIEQQSCCKCLSNNIVQTGAKYYGENHLENPIWSPCLPRMTANKCVETLSAGGSITYFQECRNLCGTECAFLD